MLPDYRTRQRDYLLEIARAMTQELDLEKLLERILRLSVEILAGQAGLIALQDDAGKWSIAAAYGISPTVLEHLEPLLTDVSIAENQSESDPDRDEESPDQFGTPEVNRLMQTLTRVARTNLLSGVALPLSARERVIGLIFIFRAYPDTRILDRKFDKFDMRNQSLRADICTLSLRRSQLHYPAFWSKLYCI